MDVCSTFLNGVSAHPDTHPDPDADFEGWARWSGTSFAAALVTGAIAAGIEPGRISGRQALDDVLSSIAASRISQGGPSAATPTLRVSIPVW